MAGLAQELCDFISTRTNNLREIQEAVINVLANVASLYPDHARDRAVRGLQEDLAKLVDEHVARKRAEPDVGQPWGSA